MPTLFVDNAGSNTSPYDTWAKAATTLATAAGAAAAGDTIYVASTHSESTAGAVTVTFPNSNVNPVKVYCAVASGASGVSALATTAVVANTGANDMTLARSAFIYGVQFHAGGGGSNTANLIINNSAQHIQQFSNCTLALKTTAASRTFTLAGNSVVSRFINCTFEVNGASQVFNQTFIGNAIFEGCTLTTAGSGTWGTVCTLYPGGRCTFSGCDMSAISSTTNIFYAAGTANGVAINCKMPASWSGATHSGTGDTAVDAGGYLYNSDSTDTNYRIQKRNYAANMVQETTLVRTGGASDGTTPLAWKIVSTANCDWHRRFESPEIVRWNETIGSALTATVEILRDSATNLTDAEIWLEIMYLGTSGVPLGTRTSDRAADILATPADQADSSATWTTTGMSNPNTQKLSVSFTPQEKGFVHARVVVAKASTTLYVCPVITLA